MGKTPSLFYAYRPPWLLKDRDEYLQLHHQKLPIGILMVAGSVEYYKNQTGIREVLFDDGFIKFANLVKDGDSDYISLYKRFAKDEINKLLDVMNSDAYVGISADQVNLQQFLMPLITQMYEERMDFNKLLVGGWAIADIEVLRRLRRPLIQDIDLLKKIRTVKGPGEFGVIELIKNPKRRNVNGNEVFDVNKWQKIHPYLEVKSSDYNYPPMLIVHYGCPYNCAYCSLASEKHLFWRRGETIKKDVKLYEELFDLDKFGVELLGEYAINYLHKLDFLPRTVKLAGRPTDIVKRKDEITQSEHQIIISLFGIENFSPEINICELGRGYDAVPYVKEIERLDKELPNFSAKHAGSMISFTRKIEIKNLIYHFEKVKEFSRVCNPEGIISRLVYLPDTSLVRKERIKLTPTITTFGVVYQPYKEFINPKVQIIYDIFLSKLYEPLEKLKKFLLEKGEIDDIQKEYLDLILKTLRGAESMPVSRVREILDSF